MRIEIKEKSLKINVDGQLVAFSEGDQVTVADDVGQLACAHGWAIDLDGKIASGDRVPGANAPLVPAKVKSATAQKVK